MSVEENITKASCVRVMRLLTVLFFLPKQFENSYINSYYFYSNNNNIYVYRYL